ncbi:897_t:CDS:2 [Gigaspora margarita]|uniref:897_t:CDS:1 n=1 Tax=Gigaspora margarita TaxID=4874 RepID=A0ABN7UMY2_GIGMA|nr:897_t:CDS:2 [Gigaspora margarita]
MPQQNPRSNHVFESERLHLPQLSQAIIESPSIAFINQRSNRLPMRQQRGSYVTRACTNCQRNHKKCTGKVSCERCTQHNLVCIFSDLGKKRGPKTNNGKRPKQVYVSNGSSFDGSSMLMQDHASTLSLYGYALQPLYFGTYEVNTAYAFQEVDSFSHFEGSSMLMQDHASALFLSGYAQQPLYSDPVNTACAFQEVDL